MDERRRAWQGLCERVSCRSADLGAWTDRFEPPGWWVELLEHGYPVEPIHVGHQRFFPPVEDFDLYEDSAWPRHWIPVQWSSGHLVHFVRGDEPGVWRTWSDDRGSGGAYAAERAWPSLEEMITAVLAARDVLDDEPWVAFMGSPWLTAEAVRELHVRLGPEAATRAMEELDLRGPDTLARELESDARLSLVGAGIAAAVTLAVLVLAIGVPIEGDARFAVWALIALVGTLPVGLVFYFAGTWRTARARLARLGEVEA